MDTLNFMWTWLNPSNTDGLFCSEMEEFFGGVQTVTQSQRLHSTAHKCSTFNPAADVQEDTWLTIAPRSKLSEQGNLYLMLPRSYWKQVKLLHRCCLEKKKYSSVILKLTKSSQLEAIVDIQLGRDFVEKSDDDVPLAAPCHCDIRVQRDSVQYESNFSAMRNH